MKELQTDNLEEDNKQTVEEQAGDDSAVKSPREDAGQVGDVWTNRDKTHPLQGEQNQTVDSLPQPPQEETHKGTEEGAAREAEAPPPPEQQIPDPNLCVMCRERPKQNRENANVVLCAECRAPFLKLKIPNKIKAFVGVVLAVFVFAIFNFAGVLGGYRTYVTAQRQDSRKEYYYAQANYLAVLEEYPDSLAVIFKAGDAALKNQDFYTLSTIVDRYLMGRSLDDDQYRKAMNYLDVLESRAQANTRIYEVLSSQDFSQETDDNKKMAEAHEQLKLLLDESGIDRTMVYYYLGMTSVNDEDTLKYLKLSTEENPYFTDTYAEYGNALRRRGAIAEAYDIYDRALSANATDFFAMRGMSILELLEGEKIVALDYMRRVYEQVPDGPYVAETLLICLFENELPIEANELMANLLESGQLEIDDDFQVYLNGEISVQDYYVERGE